MQDEIKAMRKGVNTRLKTVRNKLNVKKNVRNLESLETILEEKSSMTHMQSLLNNAVDTASLDLTDPADPSSSPSTSRRDFTREEVEQIVLRVILED